MSAITTHVLDTSRGRPAEGLRVTLFLERNPGEFEPIGVDITNADGRAMNLLGSSPALRTGRYRLSFETGAWFSARNLSAFYPEVDITFDVTDAAQHYHVPLLLSPFGYTTYRGS